MLYFLVIMNKATMHVHVQIFISLGYIPRSGIAESYGNCIFNHLRNWQTALFSKVAALFYKPASSVWEGSNFSTSWLILVICLFDYSHPSQCEVVTYCYMHFLMANDVGHLSRCFLATYIDFLGKCLLIPFTWVI